MENNPARPYIQSTTLVIATARRTGQITMKDPIYKIIELTGTSAKSIEEAVANAIRRANRTIKHLAWFEVLETRGNITKGRIHRWQVTLKVGFALEN